MFDVITIGSASRDVFVKSKDFKILESLKFRAGKALAMPLGSKLTIDEISFQVGGGAVNTATTFANQGLTVGALAVVGEDNRGEQIFQFLKGKNIDTRFIFRDSNDCTEYSIILSVGKNDRTILRYEGVVWHLHEFQVSWKELLQTKWLYVNHLGGEAAKLLPKIISFAKEHNIRIAWNPGSTQLKNPKEMIPLLKHVDVCILNQEEACMVTGISYQKHKEIFKKLDDLVHGLVIMTKGPKGVEVSDGKRIWSAGVLPLKKVVDRTGAGDAFGSGFVAALMRKSSLAGRKPDNMEDAIQFASANSTGVLTQWGATNGLLKKGDSPMEYGKLKIKKLAL